jgi:hypothetical protein
MCWQIWEPGRLQWYTRNYRSDEVRYHVPNLKDSDSKKEGSIITWPTRWINPEVKHY